MRKIDEILKMIHLNRCPKGFWAPENKNEQGLYILTLVEEELYIKSPAAYVTMFNIRSLIGKNSSIQSEYGFKNVYKLLEGHFGIPQCLLASTKKLLKRDMVEYNDFIKRITDLSGMEFVNYDENMTSDKTDYPWYNIFDEHEAKIVAKMYKNDKRYQDFMNRIFYSR